MTERKLFDKNLRDFEDDFDFTNVPIGKVNRERLKTPKFPQHGGSLKRVIVPIIEEKAKAAEEKAK
ncbi:hypothetical protein HY382_00135 [Candidatus Curtissbacteria bacterium]|nr:hypothetical protein [Candidatus Curtissbacteria bacterium]